MAATPTVGAELVHRHLGPVQVTAVSDRYVFYVQTSGPRRHGKTLIAKASTTLKQEKP
jgi:hypothetical protein